MGEIDYAPRTPFPINSEAGIAQTPTVSAASAYADGDAVGGLLTFANASRGTGWGGVLKNLMIVDDAGQDATLELWLFNQTFTATADNAAWAPTEAQLHNVVAVISTADSAQGWASAGTPSVIDIEVARAFQLTGTSLFGQLVNRTTTPTFTATDDVTVTLMVMRG